MRFVTLGLCAAVVAASACETRTLPPEPSRAARRDEVAQALASQPTVQSRAVDADAPVHLGLTLFLTHEGELQRLKKAQQDPASPEFRRWLTPAEFGARFGQSDAVLEAATSWLSGAGLSVKVAPNRFFVEATGTAAQVEALFGVSLVPVEGEPPAVHVPSGPVALPKALDGKVRHISGLDTRVRFRRHLQMAVGPNAFGPQDLRRFYGLAPLHQQGWVGQGQELAVLAMAWRTGDGPVDPAIDYFIDNVSNGSVQYVPRLLPNPQNDVAAFLGAGTEWSLDVEAQSVGVPGADSITLVVSPASEVFTTGANDIVNNLPQVTAVSISLGLCEPGELYNQQITGFDEMGALRQAVTQGVMQGQTWAAASGDNGADDCSSGTPAVDFPSSLPEIVAAGGSMLASPPWDSNHALTGYVQEETWNSGGRGGAAGGGLSQVFARPSYQVGVSPDGGRSVPDIALLAGPPGMGVDDTVVGQLYPVQGTSVASPLAAGFFALIASRVGCRLGDVHDTLYALGQAQLDGGAAVFHDITQGNLTYGGATGPAAGPGYDSATGWGALDVAALAAAWPACPAPADGGLGPWDAGAPYDACTTIGCADAGCVTLPSGPSTCASACDPLDAGSCASGTVCTRDELFGVDTCVAGCNTDADCFAQPGTVCSRCARACVAPGAATAKVGDACTTDAQCPSGAYCSGSRTLTNGYCTYDCELGTMTGDACGCPGGSTCGTIGRGGFNHVCVADCAYVGADCGRAGYVCQHQLGHGPACLPSCTITTRSNGQTVDSCQSLGTNLACDVDSGICGGPVDPPDAGAGSPDAGGGDPLEVRAVPTPLGPTTPGCGCTAVDPSLFWGLGAVVAAFARRRRSR